MKKSLAIVLLSAFAAIAFAADSGFYAGVTLGRSSTATILPDAVMTTSSDTVAGVLAGYQITKNWAAEMFYTGAGKWAAFSTRSAANIASGKADAWGVNLVGTQPLSDAFSLYGKLGYASTKTSATTNVGVVGGAADLSVTRSAATYGLGGVYNVSPAVGSTDNYNASVYALGAVFKF